MPYIHMGGKIGVLVNMEVEGIEPAQVTELGKDVAMQIAAMNPLTWTSPTWISHSGQGEGDPAGSDGQRSQDGCQA